MIGGLQYMTHTRLDIKNVVGILARFQVDLKEYHDATMNRIFRYLKGTFDYGIWYDRSSDFTLCAYTNGDWAGNMDDKKNTSGGEFFVRGRLVSWLGKKQDCISQSTTKAKYVARMRHLQLS